MIVVQTSTSIFPATKRCHDGFEFVRAHLAVAEFDPRLRAKFRDPVAHLLDRHDAVVQEINLTLALELALDGVADDALVVTADDRLDREAIERRRLDRRHVFHADERQIKRARDRRGGKREHVDELEELLEFLLVQHAEALLLVDHDQAEILENDVAGNEPVRADDDIDAAVAQLLRAPCAAPPASGSGSAFRSAPDNRASAGGRSRNAAARARSSGVRTATCLPSITALKAARIATSVLPKPTSPQISRSIERGSSMSRLVSAMAVS